MKKHFGIFVLALLTSAISCKNDEVEKDEEIPCSECGKKTGELTERGGVVLYDSTFTRYYIMMHVPGTIDSFDVAYICDMPEAYKTVGKGVVVSGTLFLTSLAPPRSFCCLERSYCLKLSSIMGN